MQLNKGLEENNRCLGGNYKLNFHEYNTSTSMLRIVYCYSTSWQHVLLCNRLRMVWLICVSWCG
jgi:hypothetical protein